MEINDKSSIAEFDKRAAKHKGNNSVLDARDSKDAIHDNIVHDFFSKKYVIENLNPNSNDIVLDYGCGVGRLTTFLKSKVRKIVGVDLSQKMIEVAKENNPESKDIFYNTLEEVPNEEYTVVFSHWVLAHMEDETIQNSFAFLKDKMNKNIRLCIFEQTCPSKDKYVNDPIYKRRTIEEYQTIFESIGFKLIKTKRVFRQPSYARAIWNKLPSSFKFLLPLLYTIEKKTLERKIEYVEYFTTFMEFHMIDNH